MKISSKIAIFSKTSGKSKAIYHRFFRETRVPPREISKIAKKVKKTSKKAIFQVKIINFLILLRNRCAFLINSIQKANFFVFLLKNAKNQSKKKVDFPLYWVRKWVFFFTYKKFMRQVSLVYKEREQISMRNRIVTAIMTHGSLTQFPLYWVRNGPVIGSIL